MWLFLCAFFHLSRSPFLFEDWCGSTFQVVIIVFLARTNKKHEQAVMIPFFLFRCDFSVDEGTMNTSNFIDRNRSFLWQWGGGNGTQSAVLVVFIRSFLLLYCINFLLVGLEIFIRVRIAFIVHHNYSFSCFHWLSRCPSTRLINTKGKKDWHFLMTSTSLSHSQK